LNAQNRRENARAECSLGDDALRAADHLHELRLYNDAVSRAYYAAFHYGRALLLTEGLEPKTHRGIVSVLEREFVGRGRIAADAVSLLARLQTFRNIADYDARQRLTETRARTEVDQARRFVEMSRAYLARAGVL
jgi:uncharacterized protein (UPF0332 family)